ncbi:MAG: hypothetical protein P1R58_13475, partial [bacterium]|nr:hypothetical protein [bacterium]
MKWLLSLFLLAGVVWAADEQRISVDDFSAGLVTIAPPHKIPLGGARTAHNIDFAKYPNEITTREGYERLGEIYGIDSFLWNGMHSMAWSDDRRELILIGDSSSVGYANIYSSAYNSLVFGEVENVGVKCDWDATHLEMIDNDMALFGGLDFRMDIDIAWYNKFTDQLVTNYSSANIICDVDTMTDATVASTIKWAIDSMNTAYDVPWVTSKPISDSVNIGDTSAYIGPLQLIVTYYYYTLDDGAYYPAKTGTGVTVTRAGTLVPTDDAARRIATRFPATGRPSFASINNRLYIGSTAGRGVVYDGEKTSVWPELSPGELFVMPVLSDTLTAGQKGRYRYMVEFDGYAEIKGDADSEFVNLPGCISKPVVSINEPIMLTNWPPPPLHHALMDAAKDSVRYKIFRTPGDFGRLSNYDTLFYVDNLSFPVGNTGLTGVDSLFTFTYVDTFSDKTIRENALGDTTKWRMAVDSGWYQWSPTDNTNRKTEQWWHPGAPVILTSDSTADTTDYGIWEHGTGGIDWTACLGYAYMAVFLDTANMSRSDSGRTVSLLQDEAPTD